MDRRSALKQAGINSHYYISPETAHEWQTWRRSLREFAPLLFSASVTAGGDVSSAAAIPAKENITGIWKTEFDSQIGRQKYTYTLKQEGTNLSGKANAEIGDQKRETELKEGRIVGDKVSFVAAVAKSVSGKLPAGELVGFVAGKLGGRGGGKPEMAQAGGPDGSKAREALAAVKDALEKVAA